MISKRTPGVKDEEVNHRADTLLIIILRLSYCEKLPESDDHNWISVKTYGSGSRERELEEA